MAARLFALLLDDTEDRNNNCCQWLFEWPLETEVDSLIFRELTVTLVPMLNKNQ